MCFLETASNQPECSLTHSPKMVKCRCKKHHRNARKWSNHAKCDDIMKRFISLLTVIQLQMGRRKGVLGKHSTLIANSFEFALLTKRIFKSSTSVSIVSCLSLIALWQKMALTLTSVGTFHNWLKQHRLYIGICPLMSDYYDKCKEFEEETTGCQQIINRLVQSGHTNFSSMKSVTAWKKSFFWEVHVLSDSS